MADEIVTNADKLNRVIKIVGSDISHNTVDHLAKMLDRKVTIFEQYVPAPHDFFSNTYTFDDGSVTNFEYDLV